MRLTENERNTILENLKKLLNEYDYEYTTDALEKIVDEWQEKKGTLIDAFKKHPNYIDGKFLIAFDVDYTREIDTTMTIGFESYLCDVMSWAIDNNKLPDAVIKQKNEERCYYLPNGMYYLINNISNFKNRTLTNEQADKINEAFPEIRAKANEKTSRVVNRICTFLHYNEHPDYNRQFARYADALSPMTIKRHTILSINPIDYLTMSFGNSWASCHTIDKNNKRQMPNSYSGCYSSGTMSYMLDGCSMVLYVVDRTYEGTDYFWQDKVNRQMFHYGNDKLVQGRLYPQSCDGDNNEYTTYRNVVQEIMSIIFDFPNLWTVNSNISSNVYNCGTHYRDYTQFSSCRIAFRKDGTSTDRLVIGAEPICIECGETHHCAKTINCCTDGDYVCVDCGTRISEDDVCWIDGEPYCFDCVTYCECCDEYLRNCDTTWIDYQGISVCEYCLNEHYVQCEGCGEWFQIEDAHYHDDNGAYYCDDCYEDVLEEIKKEEEENESEDCE